MEADGYERNGEKLLELREVTFSCNINELEKIINFLQYVKEEHSKVILEEGENCYSHYRDWDDKWDEGSVDIIVMT